MASTIFLIKDSTEEMVIIDEDVTMDNQQPSPLEILNNLLFNSFNGRRSQTKMAVGSKEW
jgi:hypothetical protein